MAPSCMETLCNLLAPIKSRKPPTGVDESQGEMQRLTTAESPLPICDRREPAIVMKNHSSYVVIFTVVQEDKLRKVNASTKLCRRADFTLNTAVGFTTGAGMHKDEEEKMEHEDNYVLMKDHKLGHNESTSVPFPRKCEDMRVYGFFQPKDLGQPHRKHFKEKVYSISRGRKIIELEITDDEIKKHL